MTRFCSIMIKNKPSIKEGVSLLIFQVGGIFILWCKCNILLFKTQIKHKSLI